MFIFRRARCDFFFFWEHVSLFSILGEGQQTMEGIPSHRKSQPIGNRKGKGESISGGNAPVGCGLLLRRIGVELLIWKRNVYLWSAEGRHSVAWSIGLFSSCRGFY